MMAKSLAFNVSAEDGNAFSFFMPLSKVEKTKDGGCIVSGYASTPSVDLDGEIVSLDAVRKALPGYWEWRNVREMHQSKAVGRGQEATIDNKGLFLTAKITDKDAVQKCLDKVYQGYSIGGRKIAKSGNTITEIELVEISLVDRPANPDCRLEVQKSAKLEGGAHLLKAVKEPSDKRLKLLNKAADIASGITEFLKDGMPNPPAAHDGFSLPAIVKGTLCKLHKVAGCADCTCAKHATVDCEKCAMKAARKLAKRNFNAAQREAATTAGDAMPGGKFPIKNQSDLDNAVGLMGNSTEPKSAVKAHIRAMAAKHGLKLPAKWQAKDAKKLAKRAAIAKQIAYWATPARIPVLTKTAEPPFLTLSADNTGIAGEGQGKFSHELAKGRRAAPREGGDRSFLALTKRNSTSLSEDLVMEATSDDLSNILAQLTKAGKTMTKAQHFGAAKANMKKAKEMRKAAAKEIKDVHAMHKAGYLAKEALVKAGKKPSDADEFDHEGAMGKLQKAFTALNSMKTFSKAASMHLAKAAGNRGPLESTEDYQVPVGVKGKTNSEMATEGPGAGETGSMPPELMLDRIFPGKAAKKASYTADEVAMAIRLASAEGKVEALEKMPAMPSGGRRPAAFDVAKAFGASSDEATSLFKGVNVKALESDDEELRKGAVSKVIGNMIMGGHGKSVFDTAFHGTAGADTSA